MGQDGSLVVAALFPTGAKPAAARSTDRTSSQGTSELRRDCPLCTQGQAQAGAAGRVQQRFCWRALGRALMSMSRQRSGCSLHILVGVARSAPGAHEFVLTAQWR